MKRLLLVLLIALMAVPPLGSANHETLDFTKISNPATIPTASINYVAFTNAGDYLAAGGSGLFVYSVSGTTLTKVADPATMPLSCITTVAWNHDGSKLAAVGCGSPYLAVYNRAGDTLTQIADPATLPTGTGWGAAFSPDGAYLVVTHNTAPYLTVYSVSGDTFTKLANPSALPAGSSRDVTWHPDGGYFLIACYVRACIYSVDGSTVARVYESPENWSNNVASTAWNPDGLSFSLTVDVAPRLSFRTWDGATETVTLQSGEPDVAGPSGITKGRWSPDGKYLIIGGTSTVLYERDGTDLTKNTANPPHAGGTVNHIAWSPAGGLVAAAHTTSPYVSVYTTSLGGAMPTDPEPGAPIERAPIFGANGSVFGGSQEEMAAHMNVSPTALGVFYGLLFVVGLAITGFSAFKALGAAFGAVGGMVLSLVFGFFPVWLVAFVAVVLVAAFVLLRRGE